MTWSKFAEKLTSAIDRHWGRHSNAALIIENAKAKSEAIKLIAQAEKDADNIKLGKIEYRPQELPEHIESTTNLSQHEQHVLSRLLHQEAVKEHNTLSIIGEALKNEGEVNDEALDEDLIMRIFEESQFVNKKDLQAIWGRLLAGTIKEPSEYGVEIVDFLRRMNTTRIQELNRLGKYIFYKKVIIKTETTNNIFGHKLDDLLKYSEWGLIQGADGAGINFTLSRDKKNSAVYQIPSIYFDRFLIAESEEKNLITLPAYHLTGLGKQVFSLGSFEPDYNYLNEIAALIKKQGFQVYIANIIKIEGDVVTHTDKKPIDG